MSIISRVAEYFSGLDDDIGFKAVVAQTGIASDSDLAELIEADARHRLVRGLRVDMFRYLDAMPDLGSRSDSLDAALDMSVRALMKSGDTEDEAVQKLRVEFPQFDRQIREAASLNHAVWSTTGLCSHVARMDIKPLPCEFGPVLGDGRPRYILHHLLGEGAFGQVYLAEDRQLSEADHAALVSIKVLPESVRDQWARQRLAEEATRARRTEHPNVVRVLDRGISADDEDFIVYEYVDGGDLTKWARRHEKGVPTREAAIIMSRIARGVHAAHMAGLVHCDLKPSNIVVTAEGEPKVADFGIAVRVEAAGSGQSRRAGRSEPMGNLAFMSPEQYRAEPGALTIPSDVYALGGMLYWLLTRKHPNGESPEEIHRTHDLKQGRTEAPRPRSARAEIDRTLDEICARALAPKPEQRHGSAASLADDLDAWVRQEPVAWTNPSLARRGRLWLRRKPGAAVASIVVGLVVAVSTILVIRERIAAATAAAGLAEKERVQTEFRAGLKRAESTIDRMRYEEHMLDQLLPKYWILERIFGPYILGEHALVNQLWEFRVDIAQSLVERGRSEGHAASLETLIWETAQAFWTLNLGEPEKAVKLFDENIDHWKGLIGSEDPWIGELQLMRLCALVQSAAIEQTGPLADADRIELESMLVQLEAAELDLRARRHKSPLHVLVSSTIRRAYGPDLLNDPDSLARYPDITDRDPDAIEDDRPRK